MRLLQNTWEMGVESWTSLPFGLYSNCSPLLLFKYSLNLGLKDAGYETNQIASHFATFRSTACSYPTHPNDSSLAEEMLFCERILGGFSVFLFQGHLNKNIAAWTGSQLPTQIFKWNVRTLPASKRQCNKFIKKKQPLDWRTWESQKKQESKTYFPLGSYHGLEWKMDGLGPETEGGEFSQGSLKG